MPTRRERAMDAVSVAICIPTFRRPGDLSRLLATLPEVVASARLEERADEVAIIVIDNDDAESARAVVAASGLDIRYVVERERGVVAVRNRALDEASGSDVIVFIDDDETPAEPRWLARLLAARSEFDADVVAGPVRTITDEPLDPWVVAGGFFDRAHRAGLSTGSSVTRAATNNLLLDRRFVEMSGVRFDPRFARTGGEDSLFTSQLHSRGARMVWCAEATVLDHLPVERRTRLHAVERTAGMANAGVRVELALADTSAGRLIVRARGFAAGAAHWLAGAVRGLAGEILRADGLRATGAKARARGRGSIAGAGNRTRELYGGGGIR
ncbi:glycosyltransferase family 2 protein [Microbacterium hydrocarbonoxydans]|uniref:glycosyltransferase family 2 protein n=1 Tax=Microbacterium hydrocarbonoxydans TaxID=273678 RepID=UPI0020400ABE|nr:glycosyltransferase [Microbacterium hydrocarbonoxydans]MCM3778121.1 glycosyltransferase [Microbacterium hydrocarbonoxydans]